MAGTRTAVYSAPPQPGDRLYCATVFNECRCTQLDARRARREAEQPAQAKENGCIFNGFPPARRLPSICYTVEWRCGAVTLMPIDLVKVHLYTELPPAPEWLDSYPGETIRRHSEGGSESESESVVPECAVVERWHIGNKQKRAAVVLEAFLGPPKFVFKV